MGEGDAHNIAGFFLGVAAHVLSEQFEMLNNVINVVREGAQMKADVIGRLADAISNGRAEDVFVAIFVQMAHASLSDGYRLDEFMYFAGHLLDQVDREISGDVGSGDNFLPSRGFGRSGCLECLECPEPSSAS